MASFTTSEYGKFASIQNNSGSASGTAPEGGVVLFSSGAVGSAKLYLNVEGSTDNKELGADLKIAGDSGTGTVSLGAGQTLTIAGGTGLDTSVSSQTVTFAVDLGELPEEAVAVADDYIVFLDGGATGASKKEKLADVVGFMAGTVTSTGLSDSNGVLSLDINNLTGESTPADADLLAVYDADAGALRKMTRAEFIEGAALDAINIDGGAIDGTPIGANSAAAGTFTDLVAGGNVDLGDATSDTITATGRFDSDLVPSTDSARALGSSALQWSAAHVDVGHIDQLGSALDANSQAITNINVDSGAVDGITLGTNSAVTQGVITSLTASHARITNLDAVTINSISQTETTLEVSDKLIVSALSASSSDASGGGLKIGGGATSNGHASVLWDNGNSALDFNIGGTTQVRLADGVLRPETDNDVDLGASGAEFKDLYLDGVAYIDDLRPDLLKMPDNTSGKILVADGTSFEEVAMSGDVAIASSGATTIQADAVESGMLNDNVISGQTELAHADIVDADELMISDGGVLKRVGVDSLQNHYFGNVSGDASIADGGAVTLAAAQTNVTSMFATDLKIGEDDQTKIDFETADEIHFYAANAEQVYVADGVLGPQTDSDVDLGADGVAFKKLFVDDIDLNGQGRIDLDADGDTSIRSAADDQIQFEVGGSDRFTMGATGMNIGAGYGSGGSSLGVDGTINAGSNIVAGADGSGANIIAYGGAANELMRYDASNHVLQFVNSSGATMLNLGGDANSEYALDVANGSNNINKVRAAAFVTYSDESLKSDVTSMANTALDTVMSLNGVEFTWKDSGERDFGFIAQDVQSVIPEAVHVANNGVQGVDYSRLTSVLVEAVKAQQVQIEELKALLKK